MDRMPIDSGGPPGAAALTLAYEPPYAWQQLLAFLRARAVEGVECVDGDVYRRGLTVGHGLATKRGWIELAPKHGTHALSVRMSASLAGEALRVRDLVRAAFDLDADPDEISAGLGTLAQARPGLRLPGTLDPFELAVRAVLGQQVTVSGARTLAARFVARFGEPLETSAASVTDPVCATDPAGATAAGSEGSWNPAPPAGLSRYFPTAQRVAGACAADVAALGIIGSRARTIVLLACEFAHGELVLSPGMEPADAIARLRALPGIGDWTAQYVAMRALHWADAFPASDLVVMKALGVSTPAQARARAQAFRPWRAYAVMHLWASFAEREATRRQGARPT